MEKAVSEAEELPKAIVRRVVKDKLSDCSPDYDFNVHKDAIVAFSESARIFIHYLSATANDICKESKRQTMNSEDVFKALEEIEFSEFVKPLKASLAEFRKKNAAKKGAASAAKEKEVKKKRKVEESSGKSGSKTKQKKGKNDNEDEDEDEDEDEQEKEEEEEEDEENEEEKEEEGDNEDEQEKEEDDNEEEEEEKEEETGSE